MNKKNGYTLLILILILMALSLLIITTTNFLGIDKAKQSVSRYQSSLGFYLSTSCAEHALDKIINSKSPVEFQEKETLVFINPPSDPTSSYSCWYSVEGELPKYIRTRSGLLDFPRSLEIKISEIKRRPPSFEIIFDYWLEK